MKKIIILGLLVIAVAGSLYAFNYYAGKCSGTKNCYACKNCKYCGHCAKNGGTCGVCQ